MRETEKAYLAGIIDGEGYIAVRRKTLPGRSLFTLRLYIAMSDYSILGYVSSITGLPVKGPYTHKNGNRKSMFSVGAHGVKAQMILQDTLPYLVGKWEIANILLSFPVAKSNESISDGDKAIQEYICNEVNKLNDVR